MKTSYHTIYLMLAAIGVCFPVACRAQQPRINTLFPIGGRAGETVEVEIRGSNLTGAEKIIVQGAGVAGTVDPGGVKVDETFKAVWQNKCASCHELRSPSNRSMTPAQWAATVDRMVKVRQAPLSADEQNKVTQYLTGLARAGKVTAQLKIAPDALPGLYEMRVATPKGISTVGLFEVGRLPEILAVSNKREQPLSVTLPCVANGSMVGNGERHYFKFTAQKAQRYVFNMKAYRYNEVTQEFFNPQLRLYDPTGKQIIENHGYYDLDPLIDWMCPTEGEYVLEVRDLLGRGNPGDVYRLAMGSVPYDTALYPPVAMTNTHITANVIGKNLDGVKTGFNLDTLAQTGIAMVGSPVGPLPLYVTAYPVVRAEAKSAANTSLPATFTGRFTTDGEAQTFNIQGNGRFEFNVYATRLGSPSRVRATLLNAKGSTIANMGGVGRNDGLRQLDMDGRMAANLQTGQVYTLKVEAPKEKQLEPEDDSTGTAYVYCVEARPAAAVLEAVARPASVTIRPGMATAVEVILARREGITGDVTVTAQDLPPGVTVTPAAIQPDRNRAFVILTADASAKPADHAIHIVATAKGVDGEVTTRAVPQELYQIANDRRWHNRADCLAVVRGLPEFTASLVDSGPIRVQPKKAVEVKVKIQRREGFKGSVLIQIDGLPSGWVANQVGAGPDQNEVTMIVRPDGNNRLPFLQRDPKWTSIRAIVTASVEEYEFVIGTPVVVKADNADTEEKNNQDR
jgi:hypothetical protein